MPEAYALHEARLIQEYASVSAADSLIELTPTVPLNRVRTFIGACYSPSVAELRIVFWAILSRAAVAYPVTIPISIALSSTILFPLVTEGMELKLYPGERLYIKRDVATAGSTMSVKIRFIDSDLPYYAYEEPLNKVVLTSKKHGSVYRATGGIQTGSTAGSGSIGEGGRGGGGKGEPQPI